MAGNDASIATAYIELVPTISGIQGSLQGELRQVERAADTAGGNAGKKFGGAFGTALKGMAGLAAGAFAVDKLKDFAVQSVAVASDLNEVGTKTNQIFGDAAGGVAEFASRGAKALGQSNLAIQNSVAGFGVYGKAAGLAGKDNVEFSSGLTKLATDMASFSNTSVEDATAALSSGLRGEAEPLRAYGVLLDDASLRNEALAQGLITTTKDALTPQQKVLASHALIMKQTADAQGDFEKTSGGLANQQRILAAQMEDMKGKVGQAFLPGITAVVSGLNEFLFPALDKAGTYVSDFFSLMKTGDFTGQFGLEEDSPIIDGLLTFRDIVKDIAGVAGGQLKSMFDAIVPVFKEVGGTLGGALVDVFKQLWPVLKDLVPVLFELFQSFSPIHLVMEVLLPLLPQIADLVADLARMLGSVLSKVLTALTPLFQAVVGVIQRLMPFVQNLVASLLPPLMGLFEKLAPLIMAVVDALLPLVTTLADALIPVIEALMPIVETVFGFVAATIQNVITVFNGLIEVLTGVFTGDWARVWEGVKLIFSGIWDQIKNIFGTLWTLIGEFFTNLAPAIWGIVSAFAGQLATWGGQLLSWMWDGIKALAPQVWTWFSALPGEIWNRVLAFGSWVLDRGAEFFGWLFNGVKNAAVEFWNWFTSLPGWVWDKIVTSMSTMIARGAEFFGWFFTGITDGVKNLWNWATGGIDDPNSLIGGLWVAMQKVSTIVMDLGKRFVGWIVEGIGSVASTIWEKITDAFTGQAESFAENPLMYMGQSKDGGLVMQAKAMGGPISWQFHPKGRLWGPGADRGDQIPAWLSPNEYVVRAGPASRYFSTLEAMNANRLAGGGFAGAFQGTFDAAKAFGAAITTALAEEVKKQGNSTPTGVSGGRSSSYDPSSFGWVQNANINSGFTWNGTKWPGGVATGTEGVWTSLLNALVPKIPGGLQPGSQWGYENRNIAGSGNASFHSYGLALDINASANGRGLPGYGRGGQYVIPGDVAHSLAEQLGMEWGGDWSFTDPMHFEIHVPPTALGATGASTIGTGTVVGGLIQIIRNKLGLDKVSTSGGGNYPDPVAGGQFDGNVERWRPTVNQALALLGMDPGQANIVLNQIRTESSGNPRAINLTDSNARKGTPSKGLIQAIDPTFQAYRLQNLPNDVYDPLANIVAGIRYAVSRYGSLAKGMRGVAYDSGGWLMPMNMLKEPEPVLAPAQWRVAGDAIDMVQRLAGEGAVKMTVNQLPGQSAADLAREIDRRLAFAGGRSA